MLDWTGLEEMYRFEERGWNTGQEAPFGRMRLDWITGCNHFEDLAWIVGQKCTVPTIETGSQDEHYFEVRDGTGLDYRTSTISKIEPGLQDEQYFEELEDRDWITGQKT